MDRAVQIGDVCKIGERVGTVDDIGLRSLKLRTIEQSFCLLFLTACLHKCSSKT